MKRLKKVFFTVLMSLVLAFCFVLAACGDTTNEDPGKDTDIETPGGGDTENPGGQNPGEQKTLGSVSGEITAYGKKLSGVKVAIGDSDTVSSATGKYTLSDITVGDCVVTFTKDSYTTVTKNLTAASFAGETHAATLNVQMHLATETATVSGTVTVGGSPLEGASVKVGELAAVTTNSDGAYSVSVSCAEAATLTLTVTHPACLEETDSVEISAGAVETITKDIGLTPVTVPVINKTYFELNAMQTTSTTDFKHVQNSEMWYVEHGPSGHRVINDHGEGLCLHVDNNVTDEDMVPAIYQKLRITSSNSKMMFRARGFLSASDKPGLLSVRVVNLTDYTVDELKQNSADESAWYKMDSNGYVAYAYDLSAYKDKDVVVIIGAKQGNHNAIERIRFIGENENWVMPYTTAADLASLTAVAAADVVLPTNDRNGVKAIMNDGTWNKVGDQEDSNEGWLLKDADYAAENSEQLRVFMYKKFTFSNVGTIKVHARTFTNQNSVTGHDGQTYPQIIIRLIDEDGNLVNVDGNLATVDNGENCQDFYITTEQPLSGDYTFVIGMARGQRLAIEQILFKGVMTEGTVTGTAKMGGSVVANANVSYTYGKNIGASTRADAQGQFALPIKVLSGDSVTVTVSTTGAEQSFTVNESDIADGTFDKGDVTLVKIVMTGLTTDDVAALEVRTDTTFGHSNDGKGALQKYWSKYGDVDWGHGEGACIQLSNNNPVSYMYAKFTIDSAHTYMKLNARMFLRGHTLGSSDMEDQPTAVKVTIITEDGTATVAVPMKAYRSSNNVTETNVQDNLLINNDDNYTEGVYNLSAYANQTVVIVVEAVYFDEINGKQTHNAINEIAFSATEYYA